MTAPDSGSVSVVIATHNRADRLPRLIELIADQKDPAASEIIVVDDGSRDDTGEVLARLQQRYSQLRAVRPTGWRGPAAARNLGWHAAQGGFVVFTDDDCLPTPGWLGALQTHFADADVIQGRTELDPASGGPGMFGRWIHISEFSDFFETCNIAYRRTLLEELGGFDEAYGRSLGGAPNGEDIDLGWRAVEHGARCAFAPDAVVQHPVIQLSLARRLRSQLRSATMAYTVRRHPGLRRRLTLRVFFSRSHPSALCALAGIAAGVAVGGLIGLVIAVVAWTPYLVHRTRVEPLQGRRRYVPLGIVATWVIDLFDIAVLAAASARWRRLIL